MKKKLFRLLSMFLCVLMISQTIPFAVYALELRLEKLEEEQSALLSQLIPPSIWPGEETPVFSNVSEEAVIVSEITQMRESNKKYFLMSDRSIQAAIYDVPVHYWEDGEWKDIEIAFTSDENELSQTQNLFETKFAKKSNSSKLVTLVAQDAKVSWHLLGAKKVDAASTQPDPTPSSNLSSLKNLVGSVIYPDILTGVDLEYIVSPGKIKENIILKNASAPESYSFSYKLKHLSWRETARGAIELVSESDSDEIIFTLDQPYMIDALGEVCHNVVVSIVSDHQGFTLTLTPDSEWLSDPERAWPVVIDPTTSTSQNAADIWDISIASGNGVPISYVDEDLLVGHLDDVSYRSLIRFPVLPDLGLGGSVVKASLNLNAYSGPYRAHSRPLYEESSFFSVNVHRVTAYWPDQVLWGAIANSYEPVISDYFIYNTSDDGKYSVDITGLVADWYQNPSDNFGVMLKIAEENPSSSVFMQFASSDYGTASHSEVRPRLSISYRSQVGLEDYWSYTAIGAGDRTVGYINNATGSLTVVHNIASYISEITGFSLSAIYQSSLSSQNLSYGNGWRLSATQTLVPFHLSADPSVKYRYTDSDGTDHYLVETTGENGALSIVDEDGLGITYSAGTDGFAHRLTFKDKSYYLFDSAGKLERISDANQNTISYQYNTSGQLTSITTSSGGQMSFAYSGELLSSVTDPANRLTTFEYAGNLLTKITAPDGSTAEFTYSGNLLTQIQYANNNQVTFAWQNGKVTSVSEFGSAGTQGNSLSFEYEVRQTRITKNNSQTLTYQFDTYNRPIGVYDGEDNAYSQSYTPFSGSVGILANNKLSTSSGQIHYINNYLKNLFFTSSGQGWQAVATYEDTKYTRFNLTPQKAAIFPQCLEISNYQDSNAYIEQTGIQLPGGKSYTFSAYLKTNEVSESGACLKVNIAGNNGSTRTVLSQRLTGTSKEEINQGYTRISVSFYLSENESVSSVACGLFGASGQIWVEGLQLEDGSYPNHVNLLANSSMEEKYNGTPVCFQQQGSGSSVNSEQKDGAYSYRPNSSYSLNSYLMQSLPLSGKAGDVFSFGSWVKANAVPSHETDGTAGLKAVLRLLPADDSGESQWFNINFNEYLSQWQFGSSIAVAQKPYNGIEFYLCFYKNPNTAYFDAAFLYRDTAQSYSYDAAGNLIALKDYASQDSYFNYDGNLLAGTLGTKGAVTEYRYDAAGNLIYAGSGEGISSATSYNGNGSPTSSVLYSSNVSHVPRTGKTYYIQSKEHSRCLTASGSQSGSSVVLDVYKGLESQMWTLTYDQNGSFVLVPKNAPELALDIIGAANENETGLQIYTKNQTAAQSFALISNADGSYTLSPLSSDDNKLITATFDPNNPAVYLYAEMASPGGTQSWFFHEVYGNNSAVQEGIYEIRSAYSSKYLDVPNAVNTVGTYMTQYESNHSAAQQFLIERHDGTFYYKISPLCAPGQYLRVSTSKLSGSFRLELGDSNVTDASLFRFSFDAQTPDGLQNKAWRIYPKCNESLSFDVCGWHYGNGGDIILYPNNNYGNQAFFLEKIENRISSSAAYTPDGNHLASSSDALGTTTYQYNSAGLVSSVTAANGAVTSYTYNSFSDDLLSVSQGGSLVSYLYEYGNLSRITSPSGAQYHFLYDEFQRNTSIAVGNQTLASYSYDSFGRLSTLRYKKSCNDCDDCNNYNDCNNCVNCSACTVRYVYDALDRIKTVLYDEEERLEYTYNKSGELVKIFDLFSWYETFYTYDFTGRLLSATCSDGSQIHYDYDYLGRIANMTTVIPGEASPLVTVFHYGSGGNQLQDLVYQVDNVQLGADINPLIYAYDSLGRKITRSILMNYSLSEHYIYKEGSIAETTTPLVERIEIRDSGLHGDTLLHTYSYTYDSVGNITEIYRDGDGTYYCYDSKNQLIQSETYGDVWAYTYDNNGNLLSKQAPGMTPLITYGYDDPNWPDLLTSYNGQTITYDAIGNPINYINGMQLSWERGRKLAYVDIPSQQRIAYYYDANGQRIYKSTGNATTSYYWQDGYLLGQKTGDDILRFLYDETGRIYGFLHNTEPYYYCFNLQGDVIAIFTNIGAIVAEYDYDDWGKPISISGDTTIANLNPIRYRGYYYDAETGFYYLNSRYYDPEIGRFINADGYVSTGQGILGYNMFAYCGNNPINRKDPNGQGWITALIVTTVAVVCIGALSSCSAQPTSDVGAAKPYVDMPGSDDETSPNCYAYAIGSPVNEQPGGTSGRIPTKWYDVNDVGKSVEADLKAKGHTVRKISGPDAKVYDNEFKIALRVGTQPYAYNPYTGQLYYDYHFMRQTNTGQWAEKHGYGGASILWDAGMTPDTIPWTLGDVPYYDSEIIYYAVGN